MAKRPALLLFVVAASWMATAAGGYMLGFVRGEAAECAKWIAHPMEFDVNGITYVFNAEEGCRPKWTMKGIKWQPTYR